MIARSSAVQTLGAQQSHLEVTFLPQPTLHSPHCRHRLCAPAVHLDCILRAKSQGAEEGGAEPHGKSRPPAGAKERLRIRRKIQAYTHCSSQRFLPSPQSQACARLLHVIKEQGGKGLAVPLRETAQQAMDAYLSGRPRHSQEHYLEASWLPLVSSGQKLPLGSQDPGEGGIPVQRKDAVFYGRRNVRVYFLGGAQRKGLPTCLPASTGNKFLQHCYLLKHTVGV